MIRSRFESLGVFNPEKAVSTEEIVSQLEKPPVFNFEELTGIKYRRFRSGTEDSFVLAVNAVRDCLKRSSHKAEEIEAIIFSSITKYKYHGDNGLCYIYEPAMSLLIKNEIGAKKALTFDITNACAGMLTSVYILDCMIKTGVVKNGIVVSGELITLITDTAIKEISEPVDEQFASLTVGDSGAAVLMDISPDQEEGIDGIDFVTFAEHSELCFGMPSVKNCGIAMYTKAVEIHAEAIKRVPRYIAEKVVGYPGLVDKYKRRGKTLDFIIPHQTSLRAMTSTVKSTVKYAKSLEPLKGMDDPELLTYLPEYGNTSSTSHYIVLHRALKDGLVKEGDKVLFVAFASGLVIGFVAATIWKTEGGMMSVIIRSTGISNDRKIFSPMEQSIRAAENCIAASIFRKEEIDLLIYLGIYRDDNIAEPALASIVQKRLGINPDPALDHGTPTTFSFDLMAGGASAFLYAVQVAGSMMGAGRIRNALIVTCDAHPSKAPAPDFPFSGAGAAVLLSESKNGRGFTDLMFRTSDTLDKGFQSYNIVRKMGIEGRKKMYFDIDKNYSRHLFEFTLDSIRENIKSGRIDIKTINHFIVSKTLDPYIKQAAEELEINENSFVRIGEEFGDPHTAALVAGYHTGVMENLFRLNDNILFIGAASGLTCACGVYAV